MSEKNKTLEQLIEAIEMLEREEAVEFLRDLFDDYSLTNDVEVSILNTLETYGY